MLDPRTVAVTIQRPCAPASRMAPGAWETAVTLRSSHRVAELAQRLSVLSYRAVCLDQIHEEERH
jgi:hypothetical protein